MAKVKGIRWLSVGDLIEINRRLIALQTPGEPHAVLKPNELESAQQRPATYRCYARTEDILTLAAVLGEAIIRNHPFCNANKRTAAAAICMFMALNGYELTMPDMDLVEVMRELAEGEINASELEDHLFYWCRDADSESLNASDAFERMRGRWNIA